MGGRGTFAAGRMTAYMYETDTVNFENGRFYGVKVLKGIEGSGKHGLPESSHSSRAYLKMNQDGTFNTLRIYDSRHILRLEISYHIEPRLGSGKILHYHIYDERFSKNSTGPFQRTHAIAINKRSRIYKRYQKFFKGVTI